ncbi:MAG: hypothetical protein J6866_03570 [Victivallales bacterium]|nr:hypothetical protein [Victivallales bacterium]
MKAKPGARQDASQDLLSRQQENVRVFRSFLLWLLALLVFLTAWLQLRPDSSRQRQMWRQQTRTVYVPAKRGLLADRHGTALNYTLPSYALIIRPEQLRDPRDTRSRTLEKLGTAIADLATALGPEFYASRPSLQTMENHLRQRIAMALPLWSDLDDQTIAVWNLQRQNFPGTELQLSWKRLYAFPDVGTQWRGGTRLETPTALAEFHFWNANFREPVGIDGLERSFNSRLRGEGGYEVLQTDVLSYRHQVLEAHKAQNGEDILLTMDLPRQQFAQKLLAERELAGALIVLDSQTGEVLVMASSPSGNLRQRNTGGPGSQYDRCLGGYYPPGSTLKPLLAAFALQKGIVTPEETIDCHGAFEVTEGKFLACNNKYGHGPVNLSQALACSCNVYFCEVGRRLGALGFEEFSETGVLGRTLGTELWRQEIAGYAFSPSWVYRHRKQNKQWLPFDNANASIGQGAWIITPMQMAVMFNEIVTGKLFRPKLVCGNDDNLLDELDCPPEGLAAIREGLRLCTEGPNGTGRALRIPGVTVLGKTGTAEVGKKQRPHAWCVAAVPADAPKYTGVCIIEHGGGGGKVAAPILQAVLREFVRK